MYLYCLVSCTVRVKKLKSVNFFDLKASKLIVVKFHKVIFYNLLVYQRMNFTFKTNFLIDYTGSIDI